MVNLAAAAGMAVASADGGGTQVALKGAQRYCDASVVKNPALRTESTMGSGMATIRKSGSMAVADVYLSVATSMNTPFSVGLIQVPRPTSASCGPGAPGTAYTTLVTNGGGEGRITIQDTIRPGTTGVWVIIERPSPHSQDPAEYYTSDFLVPV